MKFFIITTFLGLCLLVGIELLGVFLVDYYSPSKEILVAIYSFLLWLFLYFGFLLKKYDVIKGSFLVPIYAILMVLLVDVNMPNNIECDGSPRIYSIGFQISFDILSVLLILGCIWNNVSIKGSLFRKIAPFLAGLTMYLILYQLQYLNYIINPILSKF